ncbi:hypothetical protein [Atopococcus tabaci]|uniref:hypothetical protein n=1 Tax=Atopococcus tabaci TaxID=269774 RepID=UPI0003FACEE2|nr:hypothetical protein [Atopococcus tabaci]
MSESKAPIAHSIHTDTEIARAAHGIKQLEKELAELEKELDDRKKRLDHLLNNIPRSTN